MKLTFGLSESSSTWCYTEDHLLSQAMSSRHTRKSGQAHLPSQRMSSSEDMPVTSSAGALPLTQQNEWTLKICFCMISSPLCRSLSKCQGPLWLAHLLRLSAANTPCPWSLWLSNKTTCLLSPKLAKVWDNSVCYITCRQHLWIRWFVSSRLSSL